MQPIASTKIKNNNIQFQMVNYNFLNIRPNIKTIAYVEFRIKFST